MNSEIEKLKNEINNNVKNLKIINICNKCALNSTENCNNCMITDNTKFCLYKEIK